MSRNDETYTLEQLCVLVDLPKRTIRYYVQQGLVDRPMGEKRGSYYTRTHLETLLKIKSWQQTGLNLTRIGELLSGDKAGAVLPPERRRSGEVTVWSHLFLGEGVELHIEPKSAGLDPAQLRELVHEITAAIDKLKKGKVG